MQRRQFDICFYQEESSSLNTPRSQFVPIFCLYISSQESKLASLRSRRRQYPTQEAIYTRNESIGSHSYSAPQIQTTPTTTPLLDTMTTGRDRTAEFSSVVKSLQSYQSANRSVRQRTLKPSEVMMAAKRIGYDISCTCTKLEKLTELAKGRSLFGDPTSEIQELTQVIKQDLSKLNSDIASLQQRVKNQSYGETKHMRSHSSSVVVSLQSKLVDLSKDFKGVLELRTENLKQQKQRREQFSSTSVSTSFSSSPAFGGSSVLMQSDRNGSVSIDMDSLSGEQQNQLQLIEQQDAYIQERAEAMDNIHSTIVELGSIFRQLAEMVKEQEEQVVRIDANVSETQLNVEAAHTELLKYFKGITSNRWLMVKIFLVVIIFFIIFIVFVA